MKVFIQIVDTRTGIHQSGMIDEHVIADQEIPNALSHFGVVYGTITWISKTEDDDK